MKTTKDLCIGMAGSGGDGIVVAGEALLGAVATKGYHAVLTKSFGPQIRGGESSCRLRVSTQPVPNPGGVLDVAVALNWPDFMKFGGELPVGANTCVIYEAASGLTPEKIPIPHRVAEAVAVPIAEIAKSHGGDRAKNTVVLGLLSTWFHLAPEAILAGLKKRLYKKGPEVYEVAVKAFEAGAAHAAAHPIFMARQLEAPENHGGLWLADGNDMCASAAIFAGCEFFGGYPITPSSEIMHALSRDLWGQGGALLQAEDEIAGIGAAVGASFAGRKSMTATSGPGMSLKTEMLGLATLAEIPLVVVNVQRGGPATGMPSKNEQSDLFQAVFSGHGDVLRPVLAPTQVRDTFRLTVEAFNLAEQYQTPVILLSDQDIAMRKETLEPVDLEAVKIVDRVHPDEHTLKQGGYKRFAHTPDHVSPMSHPGMAGGAYLCSGLEHDETGAPASGGANHQKMLDKRFHKFDSLHLRKDLFEVSGPADAPWGFISWGSTAGICREAARIATEGGHPTKVLVPLLLYPVVESVYEEFFKSLKGALVVEQSYQGQLYRLVRMFMNVPAGVKSWCRAGANPIRPSEVVAALDEVLLKKEGLS